MHTHCFIKIRVRGKLLDFICLLAETYIIAYEKSRRVTNTGKMTAIFLKICLLRPMFYDRSIHGVS